MCIRDSIETVDQLEALYGTPAPASLRKVADHVAPVYARLIEAAPFLALATVCLLYTSRCV